MKVVLILLGFALAALICSTNFYLSFVRYPVFRWRGGQKEDYRWASGIPLVGSGIIVGLLVFSSPSRWLTIVGLVLLAIDTGGPLWLAISVLRGEWRSKKTLERTDR